MTRLFATNTQTEGSNEKETYEAICQKQTKDKRRKNNRNPAKVNMNPFVTNKQTHKQTNELTNELPN
jgi:hypothetical protein